MNETELHQLLNMNNKETVIDYINALIQIELRSKILKQTAIKQREEYYARMKIEDLKLIYDSYNHLRLINLSS